MIIAELKAEVTKLELAIAALESVGDSSPRTGRGRTTNSGSTAAPRRKLSAAGRARIVAAQKARWAKVRSEAGKSRRK